jgi:hypothetical protein
VVRFDAEYRDLEGLLEKARPLDTRLLCGLPPTVWDSVTRNLITSLTDQVIDNAVRQMPSEYVQADGARLTAILRARRDRLPAAASQFRSAMAESCNGAPGSRVRIYRL